MDWCLRATAGLLLLLQVFHVALLQDPTGSTGRTIDQSWLRQLLKAQKINKTVDQNGTESSDDTFGSTLISSGYKEISQDNDNSSTLGGENSFAMSPNVSKDPMEDPVPPVTTVAHVQFPLNASQNANATEEQSDSKNTTIAVLQTTIQPTTTLSSMYNDTDLINTTTETDINVTTEVTPETGTNNCTTNYTMTNGRKDNCTAATTATTIPTTREEPGKIPSTASPTTALTSGTTLKNSTGITTTMNASTIESLNSTNMGSASGGISDREAAVSNDTKSGFAADSTKKKRSEAWGAILGTAAAVAFIGLVFYVILKKRRQREFTHRKLVEEFPSEPVLRLENSEPLDLKYDGSAYYNPGLQMDNIQMTSFPHGHAH